MTKPKKNKPVKKTYSIPTLRPGAAYISFCPLFKIVHAPHRETKADRIYRILPIVDKGWGVQYKSWFFMPWLYCRGGGNGPDSDPVRVFPTTAAAELWIISEIELRNKRKKQSNVKPRIYP